MSKVGPCKGCTERFTACSDRCPKDARGEYGYKAWKADLDGEKEYLRSLKDRYYPPLSKGRQTLIDRHRAYQNPYRKPGGSL